jgi:hypothetical protein
MARPARLTSALLARKGHALPTSGIASRKPGLVAAPPAAAKREPQRSGPSAPRIALSSDLIRRCAAKPRRTPDRAGQDRVAFTLRLDRKRYTRLKSVAARRGRSGQEILVEALDAYLKAGTADCACPPRPGRRRKG